mgnify:CR=1 FL=1
MPDPLLRLLHSIVVTDHVVAADVVEVNDLVVNPISVVLLAIRPLNETSTLLNYARYLQICDSMNRISILYRGASVFSMSGRDAAALNYLRHGIVPREANSDDVDNERRCVILPILLGRFAYDPSCCFPATRRGELTIELDIDIADTGYDGLRYSIETIELLGATPGEYERKTSIARTFNATGDQDFVLPPGNLVRGCLLFGTTAYGGAVPAPTWQNTAAYLENQQHSYASTAFEVSQMLGALMGRQPPLLDLHDHRFEPVAGVLTSGPIRQGWGGWENYSYLDFDPTRDDTFAIDTEGASNFFLRTNVGTADAARVIPIERVKLGA